MPTAKPKSKSTQQSGKLSKAAAAPKAGAAAKTRSSLEISRKPAISKASGKPAPTTATPTKSTKSAKSDSPLKKVPALPSKSTQAQLLAAADALLAAPAKKKPGRPPKNPAAADAAPAAKRGRKPKSALKAEGDEDLSDIEAEFAEEPAAVEVTAEKVKPLRMKISKAKERALMKEFGLDETVL